jgi:hypothetical protein
LAEKKRRVSITAKTRFEVFKRDSFTCQYCGRMAPDVILEVDHINPVANGGDNEILNLVTSCRDCNRGKGKRLLSNQNEVKFQQEQLKLLNEKRKQLQMLVKWKQELQQLETEKVECLNSYLQSATGYWLTDSGKQKMLREIAEYGIKNVLDAAETSVRQYYNPDDNQSVNKVFDYIGRILYTRDKQQKNPHIKQINYIFAIFNNRGMYFNKQKIYPVLLTLDDSQLEIAVEIAKEVRSQGQFLVHISDLLGEAM